MLAARVVFALIAIATTNARTTWTGNRATHNLAADWRGRVDVGVSGIVVDSKYILRWQVDDLDRIASTHATVHSANKNRVVWSDAAAVHLLENEHYYTYKQNASVASDTCQASIYVTPEFVAASGSASAAYALVLDTIRIANTLYTSSVQIALEMILFVTWTPTRTGDMAVTLAAFRNAITPSAETCVAILFDSYTYSDNVVGYAFVNGACDADLLFGMVSIPNQPSLMAVVLAHEVGHLLSANHVETYQACANSFTVMRSSISDVEFAFSTCVRTVLLGWITENTACLTQSVVAPIVPPTASSDSSATLIIVGCVVGGVFAVAVIAVLVRYNGRNAVLLRHSRRQGNVK